MIGGIFFPISKIRNFVEITPNLPFSEFNFYELYRETFEKSELGRMKKLLPLHEMAESLGLVSKSMMPKRVRKPYFTPVGKVVRGGSASLEEVEDAKADIRRKA